MTQADRGHRGVASISHGSIGGKNRLKPDLGRFLGYTTFPGPRCPRGRGLEEARGGVASLPWTGSAGPQVRQAGALSALVWRRLAV